MNDVVPVRFQVIDMKTGEEPDIRKIALEEDWAKRLTYCDMEGFAIQEDGALILCDECGAFVYCPKDRFKVILDNEPMARGRNDCCQDRCENAHFSSVGGLEKREAMVPPAYITKHGEEYTRDYLAGYRAEARAIFGPDWKTCGFSWQPAITIEGEKDGQHGGHEQA